MSLIRNTSLSMFICPPGMRRRLDRHMPVREKGPEF